MIKEYLTKRFKYGHLDSALIINTNNINEDLIKLKDFIKFNLLNSISELSSNPDFYLVEKQKDAKFISIEQIRNLQNFLSKTAFNNKNIKVVIILGAELMNLNASNACLKILEEAPKNTYIFLLTTKSSNLIITIKSRCFLIDVSNFQVFDINNPNYQQFLDFIIKNNLSDKLKLINEFKTKDIQLWLSFSSNVTYFLSRIIKKVNNVDIYLDVKELQYLNRLNNISSNYLLEKYTKINKLINDTMEYDLDLITSFIVLIEEIGGGG